jgi:SAM-dependent methyltransferase
MRSRAPNEEQAEYWNGDEAAHWLEHEARYEAMLAPFTDHLLRAGAIGPSDRVLDVGCGCGSSTRAAGRRAVEGRALGVDLSRQLLRRAEQRRIEEGLDNVGFEHADAQVHTFESSGFDLVISRFGVMFFADPVGAFANIAGALRPGGRLTVVCWADPLDNEWITVPGAAIANHVALPSLNDLGAPGPFSFADRAHLSAVLEEAGLSGVEIEELRVPIVLGTGVTDTAEFMKATGFAQKLLQDVDGPTMSRVTEEMRPALEPYLNAGCVTMGSMSWLVTACRTD